MRNSSKYCASIVTAALALLVSSCFGQNVYNCGKFILVEKDDLNTRFEQNSVYHVVELLTDSIVETYYTIDHKNYTSFVELDGNEEYFGSLSDHFYQTKKGRVQGREINKSNEFDVNDESFILLSTTGVSNGVPIIQYLIGREESTIPSDLWNSMFDQSERLSVVDVRNMTMSISLTQKVKKKSQEYDDVNWVVERNFVCQGDVGAVQFSFNVRTHRSKRRIRKTIKENLKIFYIDEDTIFLDFGAFYDPTNSGSFLMVDAPYYEVVRKSDHYPVFPATFPPK